MLHTWPQLVRPLDQAGHGSAKKFKVEGLNESWAWTERKWTSATEDTGIGDPRKATKAKGERYFREVTEKLAQLMAQLAEVDPDQLYV